MCRALDITGAPVPAECERLAGRAGAKASDRRRPGTAGQGRTCAGRPSQHQPRSGHGHEPVVAA